MQLLKLKAIPHPNGNRIDLSWEFPEDAACVKVRVLRHPERYPQIDEHSLLVVEDDNLRSVSDTESLKAGQVYYYAIITKLPDGPYSLEPANRIAAMATGPFDMAGQMYDLLPGIYKRYDASSLPQPEQYPTLSEADRQRGQLRRFLSLPGGQLDQLYSFAQAALLLHEPERVDGRLLPLLAEWIGWRTDYRQDFQVQRNEVRRAPYIQETIGTLPNVEATVKRLIQWDCRAKEFVNNIFVTNQPERLNLWVMRLNGQTAPSPAELLSLDFAYEGRPSAIVSNDKSNTLYWLFYHSPLSSGVESSTPLPPQGGWTILCKSMRSFRIGKQDFASVLGRKSVSTSLLQAFANHGLALSYDLTVEAINAAQREELPNPGSWLITDHTRKAKYKVEESGNDLVVSTEWSAGSPLARGQDQLWQRHPSAINFKGEPLVFWDVYDSAKPSWFIEARLYRNGEWTPLTVFDDRNPERPDRRSPHAVVHDGNVWLFWQERLETGWHLRYLKTPTLDELKQAEDFPDIRLSPQDGQLVDPKVEEDFFAVSDPVNKQWLRVFWVSRVTQGQSPSSQPSRKTRRQLFQRIHDGTRWSPFEQTPNGGDADDREPFAVASGTDGKLELWWSSNRSGSGSIWRSELDRAINQWSPPLPVTSGLYDQRTPVLLSNGEDTLLFFRSTEAILRTSQTDSATYTLDTRYSGCTTLDTRNRQRIGAIKKFEDFSSYTYDTGHSGQPDISTWYSRNTVGIYLRATSDNPAQIETKRQLAAEFLQGFLPIQVRLVFFIETPTAVEEVYPALGPLTEETLFSLRGSSDETYQGLEEQVNDSMRGWVWIRAWDKNPPQPVTGNPHFRTWHINVKTVE